MPLSLRASLYNTKNRTRVPFTNLPKALEHRMHELATQAAARMQASDLTRLARPVQGCQPRSSCSMARTAFAPRRFELDLLALPSSTGGTKRHLADALLAVVPAPKNVSPAAPRVPTSPPREERGRVDEIYPHAASLGAASLYLGHPFVANRHVIITSAIQRMYAEVDKAVAMGRRSLAFEGPSNHGKTWTSKAIQKIWKAHHPEPVFWFTTKTSDDPRRKDPEKAVWGNLLRALGYSKYTTLGAEVRFDVVLGRIRSACGASGTDRALIIIDEANGLRPAHLEFLKDLRSVLESEDESVDPGASGSITLVYVLIGSEKMGDLYAEIVNEGETALNGRFFIRYEPFFGLCCKEDLPEMLREMELTPPPSISRPVPGVSTTQNSFSFRRHAQAGWRMEKKRKTRFGAS